MVECRYLYIKLTLVSTNVHCVVILGVILSILRINVSKSDNLFIHTFYLK